MRVARTDRYLPRAAVGAPRLARETCHVRPHLLRAEPELVQRAFGLEFSETARDLAGGDLRPRFNIAPTQLVPIVRNRAAEGRQLTIIRRADGMAERELV
ncbi:MAG TPA: hypothetical protein VFY87_05930, partial [Geminicoccaceae bacterium]|nr:hypothetical protein [Geminicoccaceae bacterium]